jgi:transcriptional regulator of acetoin/glycerol metabolism
MTGSTETQDDQAARRSQPQKPREEDHLFLVLECDRPTALGARYSLEGVGQVIFGRGTTRAATRAARDGVLTLHVELPGRSLSRHHARLVRRHDHWQLEDMQSKNGTFVDGERVERWSLSSGGTFEVGHTFFTLAPRLATPADVSDVDLDDVRGPAADIASLLPMRQTEATAFARVAESRVPILLRGDTGTGKEVFARAAHALSRPNGPFVALQSGALAPAHVEASLFGYDEGAFAGATRRELGFLRTADGGTLFLDEVGDLSLVAQAALLRVLETGEVVPVGASSPISVDIRVIASSNQPLEALVARGSFRADLLARIAGYSHLLPPLAERIVDIGAIVARAVGTSTLSTAAGRALLGYGWPRNAREVRQCIESAAALAAAGEILPEHLPLSVMAADDDGGADGDSADDAELREKLEAALKAAHGNVAEVARAMGKRPTQVYRWAKRFGFNPAAFRRR